MNGENTTAQFTDGNPTTSVPPGASGGNPSPITPVGGDAPSGGFWQVAKNAVDAIMPPSLWETLSPADTHFAQTAANQINRRGIVDQAIRNAMGGQTLDQQDQTNRAKVAAQITQNLAPLLIPGAPTSTPDTLPDAARTTATDAPPASQVSSFNPFAQNVPQTDENGNPVNLQAETPPAAQPPQPPPDDYDDLKGYLQQEGLITNQLNDAIDQFKTMQGQKPQVPTLPSLQQPNLLQSALGAAGALFFPRFSMDAAAAPFQANLAWRDRMWQYALQNYQMQNGSWQQDMANQRGLIGMYLDQQNHMMALQQHIMQLNYMGEYRRSSQINQAANDYIRNPSEATAAALNRLIGVGNPGYVTPDQITADMRTANLPKASAAFMRQLGTIARAWDMGPGDVDKMKQIRLDIARNMHVVNPNDPLDQQERDASMLGNIPDIPSFRTQALAIRRQQVQDQMQRFNQTFDFNKDKFAQDIAARLANLDVAKQRLSIYAQSVQNADALGQDRNAIALYGAQLRQDALDTQAGIAKKLQPKITSLQSQLYGLQREQQGLKTNAEKAALQPKLDAVQGQIDYYKSLTQPQIDPSSMLPFGMGAVAQGMSQAVQGTNQQQSPTVTPPTLHNQQFSPNDFADAKAKIEATKQWMKPKDYAIAKQKLAGMAGVPYEQITHRNG